MPIADAAYEHRMYLPLAVVVTGVVLAAYVTGRWLVSAASFRDGLRRSRALA